MPIDCADATAEPISKPRRESTFDEQTGHDHTDPQDTKPTNPARPSVSRTGTSPPAFRLTRPQFRQRVNFDTFQSPDLSLYLRFRADSGAPGEKLFAYLSRAAAPPAARSANGS
jgi:hypothetical protein